MAKDLKFEYGMCMAVERGDLDELGWMEWMDRMEGLVGFYFYRPLDG